MKGQITRQKFIATAERLFQEEGYHGVGLAYLIRESGAPKGSFYFHFPGGKLELAVSTVEQSASDIVELIRVSSAKSRSPEALCRKITGSLKTWLLDTDYAGGCAVAAMTLEMANVSPELAHACRSAYQQWTAELETSLTRFDIDRSRARSLSTSFIAALEGAVIMCRAHKSTKPLNAVRDLLIAAVDS